jgi:hypothetical protein
VSKVFAVVDNKHIPLYRILWIAELPHFCGEEDCTREGQYEIRLEQDESVWGSRAERDRLLESVERWWNESREGSED